MIPGLKISNDIEERIWEAFTGWAPYFIEKLRSGGVEYLLSMYKDFLDEIENCIHKNYMSYEYLNDISIRDAIQILLDGLPDDERKTLYSKVQPMDARLRSYIIPGEFICNEKARLRYPPDIYWWYYGLPGCVQP